MKKRTRGQIPAPENHSSLCSQVPALCYVTSPTHIHIHRHRHTHTHKHTHFTYTHTHCKHYTLHTLHTQKNSFSSHFFAHNHSIVCRRLNIALSNSENSRGVYIYVTLTLEKDYVGGRFAAV